MATKHHGASIQLKIGDPVHTPTTIISNFLKVFSGGILEESMPSASTTTVAARPVHGFTNDHAMRMHAFFYEHFNRFLSLPKRFFGKIFQTLHILFCSILI